MKAIDTEFKRKQAFQNEIRDGRVYICIMCHRKLYKNGVIALRDDWEVKLDEKFPQYRRKCIGPTIKKTRSIDQCRVH